MQVTVKLKYGVNHSSNIFDLEDFLDEDNFKDELEEWAEDRADVLGWDIDDDEPVLEVCSCDDIPKEYESHMKDKAGNFIVKYLFDFMKAAEYSSKAAALGAIYAVGADALEHFQDYYQGEHPTPDDYVYEMEKDMGNITEGSHLIRYVDFKALACEYSVGGDCVFVDKRSGAIVQDYDDMGYGPVFVYNSNW